MHAETTMETPTPRSIDSLAAHGVWSPVLVPLRPDLGIDAGRFVAHARWLLAQGLSRPRPVRDHQRSEFVLGLRATGPGRRSHRSRHTPGAPDGRHRLLRPHRQRRAHPARGGHGCRRVLMLPPFYYKGMSDEGLFASFAEVIERVGNPDLRVFLYHFPRLSRSTRHRGTDRVARRRICEVVAGVKDSSGDWSNTRDDARSVPPARNLPRIGSLPARRIARRRSRLHHRHLQRQRGGRARDLRCLERRPRRRRRETSGRDHDPARHRSAPGDSGPEIPHRPPPQRPGMAHGPPAHDAPWPTMRAATCSARFPIRSSTALASPFGRRALRATVAADSFGRDVPVTSATSRGRRQEPTSPRGPLKLSNWLCVFEKRRRGVTMCACSAPLEVDILPAVASATSPARSIPT